MDYQEFAQVLNKHIFMAIKENFWSDWQAIQKGL
jgi:Fe-S cluster biosynthesis and repair protein YggX